jgi:hypothetical protein
LKEEPELEKLRFENLKAIRNAKMLDPKNYRVVYVGSTEKSLPQNADLTNILPFLENVFEEFNIRKPLAFEDYSMSVGDIVMIRDLDLSFFCDSWGWSNITKEFHYEYSIPTDELQNIDLNKHKRAIRAILHCLLNKEELGSLLENDVARLRSLLDAEKPAKHYGVAISEYLSDVDLQTDWHEREGGAWS